MTTKPNGHKCNTVSPWLANYPSSHRKWKYFRTNTYNLKARPHQELLKNARFPSIVGLSPVPQSSSRSSFAAGGVLAGKACKYCQFATLMLGDKTTRQPRRRRRPLFLFVNVRFMLRGGMSGLSSQHEPLSRDAALYQISTSRYLSCRSSQSSSTNSTENPDETPPGPYLRPAPARHSPWVTARILLRCRSRQRKLRKSSIAIAKCVTVSKLQLPSFPNEMYTIQNTISDFQLGV